MELESDDKAYDASINLQGYEAHLHVIASIKLDDDYLIVPERCFIMLNKAKHAEECSMAELSDKAEINKMFEELPDDVHFIVPIGLYTSANNVTF